MIRYEHPARLADEGSARRELRKLRRSYGAAVLRNDQAAVAYLARRLARAAQVVQGRGWRTGAAPDEQELS